MFRFGIRIVLLNHTNQSLIIIIIYYLMSGVVIFGLRLCPFAWPNRIGTVPSGYIAVLTWASHVCLLPFWVSITLGILEGDPVLFSWKNCWHWNWRDKMANSEKSFTLKGNYSVQVLVFFHKGKNMCYVREPVRWRKNLILSRHWS